MGRRAFVTALLAAIVVACSEIPASLQPSPSGGAGFVPVLGSTPVPAAARPTVTATLTASPAQSASPSTASPTASATPSPSPTAVPASEIVTMLLEAVGAQTGWTDKSLVGGLVKIVATDGTVSQYAPSTLTTTTYLAPNKRELTIVDNVTRTQTVHTILIGTDLYTEIVGLGWEKDADRAFALDRSFAIDTAVGTALAVALQKGQVARDSDTPCDGDTCYVLNVDYTEGTGPVATKISASVQIEQKRLLPQHVSAKYTYGDGLFFVMERSLGGWGAAPPIAAPPVVAAAPAPSITPSPVPTVAPTAAPTIAPSRPPTPAPTPTPVPIDPANAPTGYSYFTVGIARGTYTVNLVKERLADVTVKTLTANVNDCTMCPAKPLAQYIAETPGAVAGINGSYFCPPDYADCALQNYKYDYAVWNTLLGKWLSLGNGANGVATFAGKTPAFYRTFNEFGRRAPVTAAISNYPTLMVGGAILDFQSQLTAVQQTARTRGVLATNGTYVFLAVVCCASVTDVPYIMQALGASDALNLDAGGSSALYSGGAYRFGPGRQLPNAIVLTKP